MLKTTIYTKAEQEEKIVRNILEKNKHSSYAAFWDLKG